jgi:hypothetical protein
MDTVFLALQFKHVRLSFYQVKPKPGETIWWQYGRIVVNNLWSQISAFIFCVYKLLSGAAICHDPAVTVLYAVRIAAFSVTVKFPVCLHVLYSTHHFACYISRRKIIQRK